MPASSETPPISFSKENVPFELEGRIFKTVKVDPREWAETLAKVGAAEEDAVKQKKQVLAVSADGLNELILLAIHPDDHESWEQLREAKKVDFGQLDAIRVWIWERMTERPFTSGTPSGNGAGESEPSLKDESPSQAVRRPRSR